MDHPVPPEGLSLGGGPLQGLRLDREPAWLEHVRALPAPAWLIAGAAVALGVYLATAPSPLADVVFIALGLAAVAAVCVGLRRKPAAVHAWSAIGIALAVMSMGNVVTALSGLEPFAGLRPAADVLFVLAYLPLAAGAFIFGRRSHGSDRTVFVDTAIVGLASIPLAWVLLIKPAVPEESGGLATLFALAIPVFDILLVGLVAPIVVARASRSTSAVLLVAGFVVMVAGDILYALHALDGRTDAAFISACWLVSYTLFGASALAPSARRLGVATEPQPGTGDPGRIVVVAVAILAAPATTLLITLDHGDADLVLLAAAALALGLFVVARLRGTIGQLAATDRRFRLFMGGETFLALIKDAKGRYVYINPAAARVHQYAEGSWFGKTDPELLDPDLAARIGAADAAVRRTGRPSTERIEAGDRTWQSSRFAVPGAPGHIGVLGVDVTEQVRAEAASRQAQLELGRLGSAIGHTSDAVIVTDEHDLVWYVNPAYERMTGRRAAEVQGVALSDPATGNGFGRALRLARAAGTGWRGDVVSRRRDGSDLIAATTISPISADGSEAPSFVTIARDVTRERAAERAADRRARERLLIGETLASLHPGAPADETAMSVCSQLMKVPEVTVATVITFGLDGIATVLGQSVRRGRALTGIELDATRSDHLRGRAVEGPWVERWDPPPGHPYAERFARLGIVAHAYAPITVDAAVIGLLIAGTDRTDGVERMTDRLSTFVEFGAITATLLAGDLASRNADAAGRARIRQIVDQGEFAPVFQPIVDLATGAVLGYEALTRFADGTPPMEMFEFAQRVGAVLDLETACLAEAFAAAEHLPTETWLNVNVSPELVLGGAVERILPPGNREIVLEITEHDAISDYATFRAAMVQLRDRVKLAVDDAGAGFASLRHVVELAPSMVKLDRSLVAGIGADPAREAVVAGMVRFAQAAGLDLLAEGIETAEELTTLRRLGVGLGQGFLLGAPAPLACPTSAGTNDAIRSSATRTSPSRTAAHPVRS